MSSTKYSAEVSLNPQRPKEIKIQSKIDESKKRIDCLHGFESSEAFGIFIAFSIPYGIFMSALFCNTSFLLFPAIGILLCLLYTGVIECIIKSEESKISYYNKELGLFSAKQETTDVEAQNHQLVAI